jgi:hypothetical protein
MQGIVSRGPNQRIGGQMSILGVGRTSDPAARLHALLSTSAAGLLVGASLDPARGNLWQDAARTVPVTAAGQPVRSWRIRTLGADVFATASADARRPTLAQFEGQWALDFDGVDDAMQTPVVTPGSDKVQVFAGVRKLGTAGAILMEWGPLASGAGSINGTFYVAAPDNVPAQYSALAKGSSGGILATRAETTIGPAPDNAVIATSTDIAASLTTLRRNGVAGTDATGGLGTGNFSAQALNIGARNDASFRYSGLIFGLAVRFGPNLSDAVRNQAESIVSEIVPGVSL